MAPPRPAPAPWRRTTFLALLLALLALADSLWLRWSATRPAPRVQPTVWDRPPPRPPREDRLELAEAAWNDLPGWGDDRVVEAWEALRLSCGTWRHRAPDTTLVEGEPWGTVADWLPFCRAVEGATKVDEEQARALLRAHLRPLVVRNHEEPEGLFTGYYEPLLLGSRRRSERYRVPLYLRPPDLVAVDLGLFREDLRGRRIAGRLRSGALEPYPDRAGIEAGALQGRGLELLWVDDPVDAFFLQIQGSGRVRLETGREIRVGYAAQNGHPYFAIGRELVHRGELALEEVSLQSIKAWLRRHPEEAEEVMAVNPSYVFFRELGGRGPLGSLGVPLTPGRSLAVDPRFVPLGAPVWVETEAPAADGVGGLRPLRRLLVAQDAGGAIGGPVRGDVFWGPGREAEEVAGRMRSPGRMWVLAPPGVGFQRPAPDPAPRGRALLGGHEEESRDLAKR